MGKKTKAEASVENKLARNVSWRDSVFIPLLVQITAGLLVGILLCSVTANKIVNSINDIVNNGDNNTNISLENGRDIYGDINNTDLRNEYGNSNNIYNINNFYMESVKEHFMEPQNALMPAPQDVAILIKEQSLSSAPILMCEDGNKVILFSGNLNSNDHWNGSCLINYIENNVLVAAIEEEYVDGIRIGYKTLSFGDDECTISERIVNGDINEGRTWKYIKKGDYYIDPYSIEKNQLVDPLIYQKSIGTYLVAFYSGNTSNGQYNDDTGLAYFISFYADGCVKTLYHGRFKHGQFDDDTGSAWDICIERDKDTYYMYSKGVFSLGVIESTSEFENPLTENTFKTLSKTYPDIFDRLEWDNKLYEGFEE